ncbi:MAG: hypothetical protein LBO20_07895 [Bifidobacteriaceae bacterium]|jgi:hypothetical protein|nr:hypothetical protein [Bifidobacteriaceae bacterium]
MAKSCSPCRGVKQSQAGSSLADKAADFGETAKATALNVSERVAAKAGPKIGAAWEWASPRIEEAWNKSVAAAAPKIGEAAEALAPKVDEARDLIVERALPAIVAAADSAARAATGAEIAADRKTRSRRRRRIVFWGLFASAVAAVAYWLWRQTRPIEDPWAEEDWDDLEEVPEDLADAAGDAAGAVGEAAGQAVKGVRDAAKKASEAVKKASDAVKKAAADAVHPDESAAAESEEDSAKTD